MGQHDYTLASGQSGTAFRGDVQDGLRALNSLNSGASAPATTYAYMLWADTTNGLLKQRNAADSAWIIRGTLAESRVVAKSSAYTVLDDDFGKLFKASGTWSLALTAAASLGDGFMFAVRNVGSGTITIDPDSTEQIDGATTVALAAGEACVVYCDGSGFFTVGRPASSSSTVAVPVRQTVLSGPVDSNGQSAFGGSTGGTTVTMTGTLIASAANGFGSSGAVDVVGSGTNLSWTGLSTNGTMYLYVDVSGGALTPGSTTLAPVYQHGGTYSTTSGQFTFGTQEMVGKVGNGSSAVQTNRVFVGEVTVAGSVVTAITWYALQGRYVSPEQTITAAAAVSLSHNLGVKPGLVRAALVCQTTDLGYAAGAEVDIGQVESNPSGSFGFTAASTALAVSVVTGADGFKLLNASTGAYTGATTARWKHKVMVQRGW